MQLPGDYGMLRAITLAIATVAFLLGARGQSQAGIVIDTTEPYTGSWSSFGVPNTATYGETFTAPGENVLNSFSLYLNGGGLPLDFRAYVYQWDGFKATGSALFESSVQTFDGSPSNVPTEFDFSTGGIQLSAGSQYVAFFNASFDGANGLADMPFSGSNYLSGPYSGGHFVFFNNGSNFSLLTNSSWSQAGEGNVWFKASFSQPSPVATPEPSSLALFGIGTSVMGLAAARRRRREKN